MAKASLEFIDGLRIFLREDKSVGVEISVRARSFTYLIGLRTYNSENKPNMYEEFTILKKPFSERRLQKKLNKAFAKIRHQYFEWGLSEDEAKFPWREAVK